MVVKEVQENKRIYDKAKRNAKKAVSKAKEEERQMCGEMLDEQDQKGSVFRVAKQIVRESCCCFTTLQQLRSLAPGCGR